MKRITIALMLLSVLFVPMAAEAGKGRGGGESELRLEAALLAPIGAGDVSGRVDYRNRIERGRRQFSVEIEGFVPGDRYDVTIGGMIVGTVVVDGLGVAQLGFDDEAQADDLDQPFPANFPQVDGGESVQIGPLSGTLQSR